MITAFWIRGPKIPKPPKRTITDQKMEVNFPKWTKQDSQIWTPAKWVATKRMNLSSKLWERTSIRPQEVLTHSWWISFRLEVQFGSRWLARAIRRIITWTASKPNISQLRRSRKAKHPNTLLLTRRPKQNKKTAPKISLRDWIRRHQLKYCRTTCLKILKKPTKTFVNRPPARRIKTWRTISEGSIPKLKCRQWPVWRKTSKMCLCRYHKAKDLKRAAEWYKSMKWRSLRLLPVLRSPFHLRLCQLGGHNRVGNNCKGKK